MTSTSPSSAMPANTTAEVTPPVSGGAQAPLMINGVAVPTGPRAERISSVEDPFVTPDRGIQRDYPPAMGESATAASNEPQAVNNTATATGFTPRPDRLAEPLSAANAQAVFAPQACVFLANLSNQRSDEQLQRSVEHTFRRWGNCHAKVRRDKKKMPYAFVQYHDVEHARIAIRDSKGMLVDGRQVRAEIAKADRAVLLTRHTGGPISDEEARSVLGSFGAIEETSPISVADQKVANLPEGIWVKFAFFQDCVDARIAFNHHEHFRLVTHRPPEPRSPGYRQSNSPPPSRTPARIEHHFSTAPYRASEDLAIFVGDLPLDVSQSQVLHVFDSFGQIEFINILRKPVRGADRMKCFAFIGYDTPQAVDNALEANPHLRGHRLRVERKAYKMRRPLRRGPSVPYGSRGPHDPVLIHLYNQGIQMGLSCDQAARILTIGQHPRTSNAYDNPTFGSPSFYPHRSSRASHDGSPFAFQPGYMGYPHIAASRGSTQYGQYNTTESTGSFTPHFATDGTTYYSDPNQMTHTMVPFEPALPVEPVPNAGYSYNYEYENYTPLNPIQEATENDHRYAHEAYGPDVHAGGPYVHEPYTHGTDSGPRQEYR